MNKTILEVMHLDEFIKNRRIHFTYNEAPCEVGYDNEMKEYYLIKYGEEYKDVSWWECSKKYIALFRSPTDRYNDNQLKIAWEFANRHILKNA